MHGQKNRNTCSHRNKKYYPRLINMNTVVKHIHFAFTLTITGNIITIIIILVIIKVIVEWSPRTSDGGNGNHSVSQPIILIKIKVGQMCSIFIYKLAVGLYFMLLHLISYFHKCTAYFGAKMVTFCIIHIGNRKIFLKHHPSPEFQLILLHVSVFSYFT